MWPGKSVSYFIGAGGKPAEADHATPLVLTIRVGVAVPPLS